MIYSGLSYINPGAAYRCIRNVRLASLSNFVKNYLVTNSQLGKAFNGSGPQPTFMHIEITPYCSKRCKDCYVPIEKRMDKRVMEEEKLKKAVSKGNDWHIKMFNFIGGEPVTEETIPLIRSVSDENPGLSFYCCTNGEYYPKGGKNFDTLADQNNITMSLSIDGFRETNDRLRGAGSYDDVMATADYLASRRCFTGAISTVRPENWEEILSDDFIDMLIEKKMSYLVFSVADMNDKATNEKFKNDIKSKFKNPIFMYTGFGHVGEKTLSTKARDLYVTVDGEIYAGRKIRGPIGTIDSEIGEIVDNDMWKSRFSQ